MLYVLSAAPAVAAALDWQIVSGMSTEYLQRQVQRMAADGYRVQAIVADTAQPTIVVVRDGGGLFRQRVPASAEYRWHPSVDRLVTSAMEQFGAARVVGVLMTGMGNDGATAMTRLFREGGRTIAEAEETAVVWGMPGELVQAGGAEIVAPLDAIAGYILSLSA